MPRAVTAHPGRTVAPDFHRPTRILVSLVLVLVPLTTNAGEWRQRHVASTDLLRTHTDLGDTALYAALPLTALALIVWWRQREAAVCTQWPTPPP